MDEKVVIRYMDGKMVKGYINDFSEKSDNFSVREFDSEKIIQVSVESLKAIFFVRSFEGKRTYNEKKIYGISVKKGNRAFVKFKDAESLVGFLMGEVPWDKKKGFFLSKIDTDLKGFYIVPVDRGSNNIKIFVMLSAVEDVSIMS